MEDTSDILTFDELQEDNYYKSKFEKRLQQKINRISHSGVKGGINMGKIQQQPNEGEIKRRHR